MRVSGTGKFFHPKKGKYLVYNAQGFPVLNFSISQSRKKAGGWDNSSWPCVWWGNEENKQYMERIASEIEDKTKIYIEGYLWNKSWEYQGRRIYRTEITIDKFKIMNGDDLKEEEDIPL